MELVNQTFYFIFGSLVLAIGIGAYRQYRLHNSTGYAFFWLLTLGLMAVSSFSFGLATLFPGWLLALANTTLVFSGLALALLFRSWNHKQEQVIAPTTVYAYWIGFCAFLIAFSVLRTQLSFEARVIWISGIYGVTLAWALLELHRLHKKERSFHLPFLQTILFTQLVLLAYRLYEITATDMNVVNLYTEKPETAVLRIASISLALLVYIAIGNFLYERLWRQEEKKASDTETIMLSSLNSLALARDNETGNHIIRTQKYVRLLAERLKQMGHYTDILSKANIDRLYRAAPLHDIGKIGIPDNILYKSGPLTKEEWGVMKTHTNIGEFVLSSAKSQLSDVHHNMVVEAAIEIAGAHHEQWDGGGYPHGLKEQDIPLAARIMSLADMYDALISERVYKREWTHQEAEEEITRRSGTQFDPLVVEAFKAEASEFAAIAQKYKDSPSDDHFPKFDGQSSEQKLQRAEDKFIFLFENSPIGMAMVDYVTGEFIEVNPTLLAYTGYTKAEFLKLSFWDITPAEYDAQEKQQLEDLRHSGHFGPNEKEYIRKDGSRFPISISGFSLDNVDGRKVVWGIIEDITATKNEKQREVVRNAVLEMLAKNAPTELVLERVVLDVERMYPGTFCSLMLINEAGEGFQIGSAPHIPDYLNAALAQIKIGVGAGTCGEAAATGGIVVAEDLKTHPNWAAYHDLVDQSGFLSCWSQPILSSSGNVLGTFDSYRKERYAPDEEHIKTIENKANLISIVIERKVLEAQVQQLAFYDSLTSLPNRHLFMDRLQIAMIASKRSGRYGALIFIDLDSLKELNDEFGHHYGDLLLTETAKRLRDSVREVDTVARYGGDEFMVIMSELGTDRASALEQAKLLAEKLLTALAIPYTFPSRVGDPNSTFMEYLATASIGCKLFLDERESVQALIKQSDQSMYRAKKAGGNRVDMADQA